MPAIVSVVDINDKVISTFFEFVGDAIEPVNESVRNFNTVAVSFHFIGQYEAGELNATLESCIQDAQPTYDEIIDNWLWYMSVLETYVLSFGGDVDVSLANMVRVYNHERSEAAYHAGLMQRMAEVAKDEAIVKGILNS